MCLVILFMIIIIIIYPQEMTFTLIIENILRGCAELNAPICDQSVPGSPFLLASPAPREPGYEANLGVVRVVRSFGHVA